jgi:hypothetical protein
LVHDDKQQIKKKKVKKKVRYTRRNNKTDYPSLSDNMNRILQKQKKNELTIWKNEEVHQNAANRDKKKIEKTKPKQARKVKIC